MHFHAFLMHFCVLLTSRVSNKPAGNETRKFETADTCYSGDAGKESQYQDF